MTLALTSLNTALLQVRSAAVPKDIWRELMDLLKVEEAVLSNALQEHHGVAVLDDAQWSRLQGLQDGKPAQSAPAQCIVVRVDDQTYVLSPDPWHAQAIAALNYSRAPGVQLALAKAAQWEQILGQQARAPAMPELALGQTDIVQFVDDAILQAYHEAASDIHFETHRAGMTVKYRLDGVMAQGPRLHNPQQAEEVVSRIKVMAQLDITERRRPQDGRIHWSQPGPLAMDLRVSVMPSIFGEDARIAIACVYPARPKCTS